jgi:hypothetical protein
MEFPQCFKKRARPAQNPCRQQMGLGMKRPRLQPLAFTFAHGPLHVFPDDLKVFQQGGFKFIAALRIIGNFPHLPQGHPHVPLLNRFSKRCRPSEVSVRQLFNIAHAQFVPAHRHYKIFDLLLFHPVHAPELPQRVM